MGERGWSPLGPKRCRAGLEWRLTPTTSPLLRGLLYFSWTLSAGSLGLFATSLCLLFAVSAGAPSPVSVVPSFVVAFAAGGFVLSRLASSRHGLVFLRLRAPEPSDPIRSVVEYAPIRTLLALAAVGTLVHGGFLVAVSALEYSPLVYLLPVGFTYAASVAIRWWLPTAGSFDRRRGRLRLASVPAGTGGRRWFGAVERTIDVDTATLETVHRYTVADTAIVVLPVPSRLPVVAAVPVAVADRL